MKKLIRLFALTAMVFALVTVDSLAQEGDETAEVVLTEYSDFQCPACGYYFPMVEQLKEDFGDRLHVEYRYFPLNSHQYAALAARAAEAANNQGKYDEMHDLLFENQNNWARSGNPQAIFIGYARDLGLDMQQFRDELNASETQQTVMEQKQEGINRGVNSTPTFFLNGDKVQQMPRNYQQFKELVERYMASSAN